jgi:hypothetical protein
VRPTSSRSVPETVRLSQRSHARYGATRSTVLSADSFLPPGAPFGRCRRRGQIGHGEEPTLACKVAAEKERDDAVLDIFAIEVAWNGGPEFGQRCREVWRIRRSGGLARERARRNGCGAEKQRTPRN